MQGSSPYVVYLYIYIINALTLSSMTHSNYWFLAGLLSLHHEHSTLREEIVEGAWLLWNP